MEPDKKDRTARRWLLVLPLPAVVVGLIVLVGIWLLRRGREETPVARQPAPPVAPQPDAPPPAWKAELAAPADREKSSSAASLELTVQRIPEAVSLLQAQLERIPAQKTASDSLLVLPGDVRSVDPISRFPRHERWEIQFPPGNTIDSYARQLDFFKIELGVIGDGDKVSYLASLSAPTPAVRTAPAADDKRLYLIWQRGAMREAAQELATRAKIDPAGKVLAHFCPGELETQLAQLEDEFARQKGFRKIRRTVFGIKPNDSGGYACYVIDQKADDS
jgi:uncharacterized small protein (DUF1192 family)